MNVPPVPQRPSIAPIVWAVVLGLVALGLIPGLGTTRSGVEYLLFVGALIGCAACVRSAVTARRPTSPPFDVRPGQTVLGWMAPWTPPAGHELAAPVPTGDVSVAALRAGPFDDAETCVQLLWQSGRRYLVLQDAEVPERWLRASIEPSGGYRVDAVLTTRGAAAAQGVPGWVVLDVLDRPVALTDDWKGAQNPRMWVLVANTIYRLDQDGRGGVHVLGIARPSVP